LTLGRIELEFPVATLWQSLLMLCSLGPRVSAFCLGDCLPGCLSDLVYASLSVTQSALSEDND